MTSRDGRQPAGAVLRTTDGEKLAMIICPAILTRMNKLKKRETSSVKYEIAVMTAVVDDVIGVIAEFIGAIGLRDTADVTISRKPTKPPIADDMTFVIIHAVRKEEEGEADSLTAQLETLSVDSSVEHDSPAYDFQYGEKH
jgi:hypothetical protein